MYFWAMFPVPPPPEWVVPDVDDFTDCAKRADRYFDGYGDPRHGGVHQTFIWLTIGDGSPITGRGGAVTRDVARAESWCALCIAAGQDPPTARDWERLGVAPAAAVTDDREFAYGVWWALSWLLGVRTDWPVLGPGDVAAGIPDDRPHLQVPRQRRNTPLWLAADRAARDRAEHEAWRWWRHIRALADATA